MAVTGVVTVIPSSGTLNPGQKLKGIVALTSDSANPVEVMDIQLYASRSGKTDDANTLAQPNECIISNPGSMPSARLLSTTRVNYYPFDIVFFSPRASLAHLSNPNSQVYDIGATAYLSDGTVIGATVQSVTITGLASSS